MIASTTTSAISSVIHSAIVVPFGRGPEDPRTTYEALPGLRTIGHPRGQPVLSVERGGSRHAHRPQADISTSPSPPLLLGLLIALVHRRPPRRPHPPFLVPLQHVATTKPADPPPRLRRRAYIAIVVVITEPVGQRQTQEPAAPPARQPRQDERHDDHGRDHREQRSGHHPPGADHLLGRADVTPQHRQEEPAAECDEAKYASHPKPRD